MTSRFGQIVALEQGYKLISSVLHSAKSRSCYGRYSEWWYQQHSAGHVPTHCLPLNAMNGAKGPNQGSEPKAPCVGALGECSYVRFRGGEARTLSSVT